MSYTKTTWSDGDIITANKMNNIETGVESLNTDVGQLQTDLDSLTETVENLPTGGGDVPADYQELVDDVSQIKADLSNIDGISEEVKIALLACFEHIVWADAHGQDYYNNLHDALYAKRYNNYHYGLDDERAILVVGGVSTNTQYGLVNSGAANRRTFGIKEGVYPYVNINTGALLDVYPIPIPSDAKALKVSLKPTQMFVDCSTRLFDQDESKYSNYISTSGWIGTGTIINLPKHTEYLAVALKYSESGTETEFTPEDIDITFLKESIYVESEHHYKLSESNTVIVVGGITTNATYGLCVNSAATNRRSLGMTNGVYPYKNMANGELLNIYPVPIPDGASKVTITGTPNNLYFDVSTRVYSKESGYSAVVSASGWVESGTTIDLPNNAEYITIAIKNGASGTAFDTEPSEVLIDFA